MTAHPALAEKRVPGATYRLQFGSHFGFRHAAELLEYLADLGITDCYASPLFEAGPQSAHGYDVCCFERWNPVLGAGADFDAFASELRHRGMGLLLDMVPNHMRCDSQNGWWMDVLEYGRNSPFATFFDIQWAPVGRPELEGKVLLPVLEDHYKNVLEAGKLKLARADSRFVVQYYDRWFPLAAESYGALLMRLADHLPRNAAPMRSTFTALAAELTGASTAPGRRATVQQAQRALCELQNSDPQLRDALSAVLAEINGTPGDSRAFDELDRLLEQQHYRLAYWRVGPEEINYRRFFDVSELVGLRVERPEVFDATHGQVLKQIREGTVTGLRIDHPDGLWDPQEYFTRLQAAASAADAGATVARASDLPIEAPGNDGSPFYVVAEKILCGDESLPDDWEVDGTTGYDFLNELNGLFVDGRQAGAFDLLYRDFAGVAGDFGQVSRRCKRELLRATFASELAGLSHRARALAARTRSGHDLTLSQIRTALLETLAAFPVYRTYVRPSMGGISDRDRRYIELAIGLARPHVPPQARRALDFVADLLLLAHVPELVAENEAERREFVMRFQQLTGPVMAKAVEDTAFYRYTRLLSLNEVGGDPGTFGPPVDWFHRRNAARAERWPHSLLATATHDTKRGEDARARLNVLSEMPGEWREAIFRWRELNAGLKGVVNGQAAPALNDEYLLYQTLVATWPAVPPLATVTRDSASREGESPGTLPPDLRAYRERIDQYMRKAVREAKRHTSWTDPNAAYEQAVSGFVARVLDPSVSHRFLESFVVFQQRVAWFAVFNSLAQLLFKIASPGVPDFYQGTELWDFNLVDPDNRRPVDFERRRDLLSGLKRRFDETEATDATHATGGAGLLCDCVEAAVTGQLKMWLMREALRCRGREREVFDCGSYIPIETIGGQAEHLVAFGRQWRDRAMVVLAPRLVVVLLRGARKAPLGSEVWGDTELVLPESLPRSYRNFFTGESVRCQGSRLRAGEALASFPVALLVGAHSAKAGSNSGAERAAAAA